MTRAPRPIRATLDELVVELERLGIPAEVVPPRQDDTNGVNVWQHEADRHPFTTVWPPIPRADYWSWGPRFEHQAEPYVPVVELAARVAATVRP
jgi:hypothetical protein